MTTWWLPAGSTAVREFVELAFKAADLAIEWEGSGVDEVGREPGTGQVLVEVDERYFRPTEVDSLLGDASKARDVLGWSPRVTFEEMTREMVAEDMRQAERVRLDENARNRAAHHYD